MTASPSRSELAFDDRAKMPSDWDDHEGWQLYYSSLSNHPEMFRAESSRTGSFCLSELGPLADDLKSEGHGETWFPGCGLSPLPRVFALLGLTVLATDVSQSAIDHQQTNKAQVFELMKEAGLEPDSAGEGLFESALHDFREPLPGPPVGVVFNLRAFQGLGASSRASAARVHFQALRPGGIAFFDTQNVQDTGRDRLEADLVDAGFYVPLFDLNRWHRSAIRETGIPCVMVLGNPLIPQNDEYPHKPGSVEYQEDLKRLRAIHHTYRQRAQKEFEKEQRRVTDETKTAHVIYSTG